MKHLLPNRIPSLLRTAAALSLAAILTPATLAQGTADLVGIYSANDGTGTTSITLAPGFANSATAYVCLTGIADPQGVAGYEFSIEGTDFTDGVIVTSWNMTWGPGSQYGPLNVSSAPDFIVGQNIPLPHAQDICLMSFTFFVTDSNPKAFRIHPAIAKQSIPGKGAYIGQSDIGNIIPLKFASGDEFAPAFTINSLGSATPRIGTLGLNPGGYTSSAVPFSGMIWPCEIDTTPLPGHNAISTIVATGLGGPTNSVPMSGFELLCAPLFVLDFGFGSHTVHIPPGFVGLNFSTQGVRIELDGQGNPVVVFLNAIDLVIG